MRPGRIFLFLLLLVVTLFLLSLSIIHLKREGNNLFHSTPYDTILNDLTDSIRAEGEDAELPVADTLISIQELSSAAVKADPEGGASLLPPWPGNLIRDSLAAGRQVRVLFFGDSQLEGDRVTSLLRSELRKEGRGTGPGLISPVMPVMYTRSFVVKSSSNWKRYTLLDYRNGTLPHNSLGPMLSVCRFTPPKDSLASRSFATVRITPVPGADPSVAVYEKLRIFYGNNFDTVLVGIRSGNALVDFAMLQMGAGLMEYAVPLPAVSDIEVEFTGRNSPDIYALSLESESGVIIDNVPVRGSAGLEFVMTDHEIFGKAVARLAPDVIFMQFGLNVVRNVRSEYHYYEEGLVKQIEYMKRASGGVPVILVGVTDMALRTNDTIRRFSNIRAIRDAQQKAAARSGAIFWDAWESMGGPGSILEWRNHAPPLASRDLTHLSNAGADTIAARIYSELLTARSEVPAATGTEAGGGAEAGAGTRAGGGIAAGGHVAAESVAGDPAAGGRVAAESAAGDPAAGGRVAAESAAGDPAAGTTMTGDSAGENGDKADGAPVAESDEDAPPSEVSAGKDWSAAVRSLLSYNPRQTFIFTTFSFWIFFLVVMAGFALMHRKRAMCHTWLLLVSLYFYYRVGGLFIILLLLTTIVTWFTAIMTARAGRKAGKRFWLITNILLLLGFLSYFKYAGFITESINSLFDTSLVARDIFSSWSNTLFGTSFDVNTIILPVGISFFTFQALSYSIDVYRGRMSPERNIVDFSFYLTFFPQLVAGPIVRASEFIPQMKGKYTISRNEFGYGLFLILQGLVKKMLISDFISAGFVDRVFDAPALYSGFENLMAVYGYGLQIYCDFSGYTDIAIGVAMLMGFRLPLNFNSPYKAASVTDFWKRWHISLSRWLKDYLYIPLGGNRKGTIRTGINLMITMLLGGLWHGAAMRFVVWGGLHGIALVADKIRMRIFSRSAGKSRVAQITGIFLTFNFVSFAWIFFRAGTMDDAGVMLTQIFSSFTPGNYATVLMAYLPVVVLIVSGYIMHFLPVTVKEAYRGLFIRMPLVFKFLIAAVVAVLLYKVGTDVVQPFIYFRF